MRPRKWPVNMQIFEELMSDKTDALADSLRREVVGFPGYRSNSSAETNGLGRVHVHETSVSDEDFHVGNSARKSEC